MSTMIECGFDEFVELERTNRKDSSLYNVFRGETLIGRVRRDPTGWTPCVANGPDDFVAVPNQFNTRAEAARDLFYRSRGGTP